MGLVETLLGILPDSLVEINVDKTDNSINVDNLVISDMDGDKGAKLTENGLFIDPNSLEEDEFDEVQGKLRESFEEGDTTDFVALESSDKFKQIEKHVEDEQIQRVLEFFENKISKEHSDALQAGLHMRRISEEEDSVDVDEIKNDIEKKFGSDGRSIANLCNAGYFDEGGYLRELYYEMEASEDFVQSDYQDRFEEIIRYEPFTVFVSRYDSNKDILIETRRKLRKYNKYGVRFVDVRGIGQENIRKIRTVVNRLDNIVENMQYKVKEEESDIRIRIDPTSFKETEVEDDIEEEIERIEDTEES